MKTIFLIFLLAFTQSSFGLTLENLNAGELPKILSGKRIAYYLGSFDPIHKGHEEIVNTTLEADLADFILIYPAWGGDGYKNRTDVELRLNMLTALYANHSKVLLSKLPPQELQQLLFDDETKTDPKGRQLVKSKFIGTTYIGLLGSDAAIDTAKDVRKSEVFLKGINIPQKYHNHTIGGIIAIPVDSFIIFIRKNDSIDMLGGMLASRKIAHVINSKFKLLSSTIIREKIKNKLDTKADLSPGVAKIIFDNNLYKD